MSAVTDAITAMTNGQEHLAFIEGIRAMNSIKEEIRNCKGAPADIIALANWFERVAGSKQAMVDTASANALKHSQEITQHVEEVWATFFKFNEPVVTGHSLGKTAYWTLGPVDPSVILQ